MNLDFSAPQGWRAPVLKTVATRNEGTGAVVSELDCHRRHSSRRVKRGSGASGGRERPPASAPRGEVLPRRGERLPKSAGLEDAVVALTDRIVDPHSAAEQLFKRIAAR